MITYEEALKEATEHSDHGARVIELEPAIKEALANTLPEYPFLEIGNRDGGSAILIMWYIANEGKNRAFETCDTGEQSKNIAEWVQKLNVNYLGYNQKLQYGFVRQNERVYGFIYLDADHKYENVKEDLNILKEFVCKGGIIAVDDVEGWPDLPYIEGTALVNYDIDEGEKRGSHGHHFIAYRKL